MIDAALAQAVADVMGTRPLTAPRLAARSRLPRSTVYDLLAGKQAWKACQIEAVASGLGMRGSELLARAEALMG